MWIKIFFVCASFEPKRVHKQKYPSVMMSTYFEPIIQALAPNLKGCCVVNGLVPRTLFIGYKLLTFL